MSRRPLRGAQEAQRCLQEALKSNQETPERPLRGAQEAPKTPQKYAPKTTPRGSQAENTCFGVLARALHLTPEIAGTGGGGRSEPGILHEYKNVVCAYVCTYMYVHAHDTSIQIYICVYMYITYIMYIICVIYT